MPLAHNRCQASDEDMALGPARFFLPGADSDDCRPRQASDVGLPSDRLARPLLTPNHGNTLVLTALQLQTAVIGEGSEARQIAFFKRAAGKEGQAPPGLVWLSGFKSDMAS